MKINIRVKANSHQLKIEREDNFYRVWLNSAPEKGKANRELIERLSDYFQTPKSNIIIAQGWNRPDKIIEIKGLK